MVDSAVSKHGSGAGGKTDKQLKELRRLMPWNWDARVEEHPPGEKAMQDFEDVVNYRIDGRKRRHAPVLSQETEKSKKKPAKKAIKKTGNALEENSESNKENIPPTVHVAVVENDQPKKCVEEKIMASPCLTVVASTPMPPCKEANPITAAAPITPGFVLTPATETDTCSQKKKKTKVGRPSKLSGCEKKQAGNETGIKKNQTRKVTFCNHISESHVSPKNTARVVNFNETVIIDSMKYGHGIRVQRPKECPPLFQTLETHGRKVFPANPKNMHAMLREPQKPNAQSRLNTPYKGFQSVDICDRATLLTQVIQQGIQLRESAHLPAVIPPCKPLELSSKLAWAVSQL